MKLKKYRIYDDKLKKYYYFDLSSSYGMIPIDLRGKEEEFTGLQDINGVDIYENDIMVNDSAHYEMRVVWEKGVYLLKDERFPNSIPYYLHEAGKTFYVKNNL